MESHLDHVKFCDCCFFRVHDDISMWKIPTALKNKSPFVGGARGRRMRMQIVGVSCLELQEKLFR